MVDTVQQPRVSLEQPATHLDAPDASAGQVLAPRMRHATAALQAASTVHTHLAHQQTSQPLTPERLQQPMVQVHPQLPPLPEAQLAFTPPWKSSLAVPFQQQLSTDADGSEARDKYLGPGLINPQTATMLFDPATGRYHAIASAPMPGTHPALAHHCHCGHALQATGHLVSATWHLLFACWSLNVIAAAFTIALQLVCHVLPRSKATSHEQNCLDAIAICTQAQQERQICMLLSYQTNI